MRIAQCQSIPESTNSSLAKNCVRGFRPPWTPKTSSATTQQAQLSLWDLLALQTSCKVPSKPAHVSKRLNSPPLRPYAVTSTAHQLSPQKQAVTEKLKFEAVKMGASTARGKQKPSKVLSWWLKKCRALIALVNACAVVRQALSCRVCGRSARVGHYDVRPRPV